METELPPKFDPAQAVDGDFDNHFGLMYLLGRGMPLDNNRAVQWFTKAAEKNHADAQYNLGVMYHNGLGVSQDHLKSIELITKAAEQGHPEAIEWLKKAAE